MSDRWVLKDILYGELAEETQGRYRPRLRIRDVCKRDMKAEGMDPGDLDRIVRDHDAWRKAA